MKKNTKVYYLVEGAMIAALYVALTYSQELLLPGTTSMAVQFRLSEILCILCVFTPSAIWGLTVGTFLSNIVSLGALPLDMLFGTFATFVATVLAYKLRNIRLFSLPILSALMPVIANGIIIGLEIEIFFIKGGFHFGSFLLQGGLVALGEFLVCVVLSLPFYSLINHFKLFENIHKRI